jgi:glutaredoxin
MSSSIKLTLYTQDDCHYCKILKKKLSDWNYAYREINVSYDLFAKDFLKNKGHRTVPQLYWNDTHLNKFPTLDLTKRHIENEIDYENYVGGVENWEILRTA